MKEPVAAQRPEARDGRRRVIIEGVTPEIDGGRFPIKRIVGERVVVEADVFVDGHEELAAVLRYRKEEDETWHEIGMTPRVNDRWEGSFTVSEVGRYRYSVTAWVDRYTTWQKDLRKKFDAGQDVRLELAIGGGLIEDATVGARRADADNLREFSRALRETKDQGAAVSLAQGAALGSLLRDLSDRSLATVYAPELAVVVEPRRALFSTWYEFFPRSCAPAGADHGTFRDCERLLPEIAEMGFDVVYLPPIHPIGDANRKGKNNAVEAEPRDPGSPWAIGNREGGHKAVHPRLGTPDDFQHFVAAARERGIQVALDLAYQCSPDHPYVREHPQWFRWRPDGTIQYAENPPKKYQDVVPLDFENDDWQALWAELKNIVLFWIERGVTIFRVDNPHTKPFPFWEWLIGEVKQDHPEAIFLSEAFTRPKVMGRLAKVGFSQSYTYFTWRNSKAELASYVTELTRTELREYFRPNFWPNTPDILPEYLQYGGRPAFIIRLALAATLSSNYGMYGPAFELCVGEALVDREEYLDSEKYEIKRWDRRRPESLRDLIKRLNRIRRDHPALQTTWNIRFLEVDNESVLYFGKADENGSDTLLIVVSLDPFHPQSCRIRVPLEELGIGAGQPYLVHDLLGGDRFIWQTEWNRLDLDPQALPVRIFQVHARMRRERDFDYFM